MSCSTRNRMSLFPAMRQELDELLRGHWARELIEDVTQVLVEVELVRFGRRQDTIDCGHARCGLVRASKEEVSLADAHPAKQSLNIVVVERDSTILEEPSERILVVNVVPRCLADRVRGGRVSCQHRNIAVELFEHWLRTSLSKRSALLPTQSLAVGQCLKPVEPADELQQIG